MYSSEIFLITVLAAEDNETLEATFPKLTKQVVDTVKYHTDVTVSAVSIPRLGPDVILTVVPIHFRFTVLFSNVFFADLRCFHDVGTL